MSDNQSRLSGFRDHWYGDLVLDAGEEPKPKLHLLEQMKEKQPWQSITVPDNTDPNT